MHPRSVNRGTEAYYSDVQKRNRRHVKCHQPTWKGRVCLQQAVQLSFMLSEECACNRQCSYLWCRATCRTSAYTAILTLYVAVYTSRVYCRAGPFVALLFPRCLRFTKFCWVGIGLENLLRRSINILLKSTNAIITQGHVPTHENSEKFG